MKENRDRTVSHLRCLYSYNHEADIFPAPANLVSYSMRSAGCETEGLPLTKEGNTFHLKSVTDILNYVSLIIAVPNWKLSYTFGMLQA